MELDSCKVVWLVLIAGVFSDDALLSADIYSKDQDVSKNSYQIQIQTSGKGRCSQECLQRNCTKFSYDSQTKECLLDNGSGEGPYNRIPSSQVYRSLLNPDSRLPSRGKKVTHSTVLVDLHGRDFSGSNIVDGYYTRTQSGLPEIDSLMVLAAQQDPWFEIDLEDDFWLEGMKFWRRPNRAVWDLELTVAKDGQHGSYALCALRNGLLDLIEKVECTYPVYGRYMKVVQQTDARSFELLEVEVFGH